MFLCMTDVRLSPCLCVSYFLVCAQFGVMYDFSRCVFRDILQIEKDQEFFVSFSHNGAVHRAIPSP